MAVFRTSQKSTDSWLVVAALFLMGIATARIVRASTVFNATLDEPWHLGCGMEWLDRGRYTEDAEQPPLARIFGALLPYLAGERSHGNSLPWIEGDAILGKRPHYDRVLQLGRIGILPLFWVAGALVFLWAHDHGGAFAGLMAVAMFTATPAMLAHGGVITTDMAGTGFVTAAFYYSMRWWRKPAHRSAVVFGVALGLAAVSKFSALVFLPASWLAVSIVRGLQGRCVVQLRPQSSGRALRTVPVALGVAVVLVWAAYRFSFGHVGILGLRLPAPRFFIGLKMLWEHNLRGHAAYLLGRRSQFGFWYYFPTVLAVKTPLGMIALASWAAYRACRGLLAWAVTPLAFCAGILLVCMMSRIDIGVRHILPVYCGLSVLSGAFAADALSAAKRRPIAAAGVAALLVWDFTASGLAHPDYLAYTNELVGTEPEKILADSDLDWGQDMKRLGAYLRTTGATGVTFMPFDGSFADADPSFPRILPMDPQHPAPGWNAVSISAWKVKRFGVSGPVWPDAEKAPIRIGRGILLWRFPSPMSGITAGLPGGRP